jgi:cytochrome c-type biogenesis protein CcmE
VKPAAIVAAIAAAGGIAISIYAFVAGATPYVAANKVVENPGRKFHVAGEILHETARLDLRSGAFFFDIRDDEGTNLPIEYAKGKPGNFDSAPKVSVLGAYENGRFVATEVKTQCPSKYESSPQR